MILVTKYDLDDVVFGLLPTVLKNKVACTACGGEGRVATLDGGDQGCSRCRFRGYTHTEDTVLAPTRLTIGDVRARVGHADEVTYMAKETGIGSGRIWNEEKLFATRDEAAYEAGRLNAEAVSKDDAREERSG